LAAFEPRANVKTMSRRPDCVLGWVLWVVFVPSAALAADWHVAPNGLDEAAGTSAAPLASVARAVERSASGDRILLRRGGTYAAADLDVGAGRQILAYGTGEDPVLTASAEVQMTGAWEENAVVRTAAVTERVLACYVNGRFVPLARWPNTGFLRVDNDESPDEIVDAELETRPGVAAGRWTGAQVRWRRWSWWWETRPVTAHSAPNTLALGPEGRFPDNFSDPGSGYFIDNDLDELDAPGEWFWGDGTLYLYPPTWADPETMRVEIVTSDTGVRTSGTSFTNVQFKRFAGTALSIQRPTTVQRCIFEELETNAIQFTWDAQPFTVRGCVFRNVRNTAITGWANPAAASGPLIERNLFHRIGIERGYGGSGSWHAAAVIVGNAKAARVRLNRFVDVGYAGVILGSDGHTVERNVFARTMSTLNDGAAVYTNCNASVIRENIILENNGDLETSHPWWPLGHGIWPEFLSDFRNSVITDNTVYGSNGHGIMLPNNFTCTVTGNVCLDNRRAGLGLSGDANDDQNHVLRGNLLAAVSPSRRLVRPENLSKWWLPPYPQPTPVALEYQPAIDYGQMTETTFIVPTTGAGLVREENRSSDFTTLSSWATAAPSWASEAGSRLVKGNAVLLFNDTEEDTVMAVPAGTWRLPDGSAVGTTVTVAPFRSVVLVTDAAVATAPPYHAASGIDWRADEPTDSVLEVAPEIEVTRAGVVIQDGRSDVVSGSLPAIQTALGYTITNRGSAALTLTVPVGVSGEQNCTVTVVTQPGATVAAGGTTSLSLGVTPRAAGAWSFRVSFGTNDTTENPMDWTGSGSAGEADRPDAGGVGPGEPGSPDAAINGEQPEVFEASGEGCSCGSGSGLPVLPALLLFAGLFDRKRRG